MRIYYGDMRRCRGKAAAIAVITGSIPSHVEIDTPKGIRLDLEVTGRFEGQGAVCTVIKDSGDDPDVTDGMPVCSLVTPIDDEEIIIDGGEGVGRVTRPGLWQQVGEAAINKVPRQMITSELARLREDFDVKGGFRAEVILPRGRELAERTFNPRLGIEGGLSVLGTSGIVEPMSEEAIIESIRLELNQKRNQGKKSIIITPGNYGADFVRELIDIRDEEIVKCSNYVGMTIDIPERTGI